MRSDPITVSLLARALLATVLLVLPASAVGAAPALRDRPYVVTGVVLSVERSLLALRVDGGGTATFRLLEPLPRAGEGASIAPGVRVRVWVLAVPEGPPLALRVLPLGGFAPARLPLETGALRGVVLAQSGSTLSVLDERNILYTVLVTGTTVVTGGAALPHAVVQVDGVRNSDGSVSARTLRVLFDPRNGTRVSGRIAATWPELGLVLGDGTVVVVTEQTWIVRGTTLRPSAALAPGAAVTVLGVGVPPYLSARVIEISL